jgi:hypothetical protein
MYHFMDVRVRSVAGGVGTYDLAAGESLPLGTAPDRLIQLADGSAVVPANGAVTRSREVGGQ